MVAADEGRLDEHLIDRQALTGNPLSDPHQRPLWVWTPPGYDPEADRRYPVIYRLQSLSRHSSLACERRR